MVQLHFQQSVCDVNVHSAHFHSDWVHSQETNHDGKCPAPPPPATQHLNKDIRILERHTCRCMSISSGDCSFHYASQLLWFHYGSPSLSPSRRCRRDAESNYAMKWNQSSCIWTVMPGCVARTHTDTHVTTSIFKVIWQSFGFLIATIQLNAITSCLIFCWHKQQLSQTVSVTWRTTCETQHVSAVETENMISRFCRDSNLLPVSTWSLRPGQVT